MFGKRSMLRTGKLAKKRRQAMYVKLVLVFAIALGLIGGASYGLSRSEVMIADVAVSGIQALSEQEVRTVAEQKLSGKYFFLFPKRSVLLFPKGDIEAAVLDAYKRVRDVTVSRVGLTSITVAVEEREPFAVWCSGTGSKDEVATTTPTGGEQWPSLQKTEPCYFLDEDGYIFARAPHFTGNVYFRYYGGVSGEPIGSQYLSPGEFRELAFFLRALEALDVNGVSLEVFGDDVVLNTRSGMYVRFGREQDLTAVLNNLESALSSDAFQGRDFSDVEYIDLRFGERVFYRFEDE